MGSKTRRFERSQRIAETDGPKHTTDSRDGDSSVGVIMVGSSQCRLRLADGTRREVSSYVGYPRDELSASMLGDGCLVGESALKHRGTCDLYRPFYDKNLAGKDPVDGDGPVNSGDPVRIHQAQADLLDSLFSRVLESGAKSLVLALPGSGEDQLAFHALERAEQRFESVVLMPQSWASCHESLQIYDAALVVDVGASCTLLSIHTHEQVFPLAMTSVPIGGDDLDRLLHALLARKCKGAAFKGSTARRIKENWAFVMRSSEPAEILLPVDGRPVSFDVTQEVCLAVRALLKPLISGVSELIESVNPEIRNSALHNILLTGGGAGIRDLDLVLQGACRRMLTDQGDPAVVVSNAFDGVCKIADRLKGEILAGMAVA